MIDKESLVSPQYLKECFDYTPDTGDLTWRHRPLAHFKNEHARSIWQARYAGTQVGALFARGRYKQVSVTRDGVRCNFMLHRVVWALSNDAWPRNEIDHINGDGLDNRISNLRDVGRATNAKNLARRKSNSSGVTGVSVNLTKYSTARFTSLIGTKCLYWGSDFFEAICARKSAELKLGFHANHGR